MQKFNIYYYGEDRSHCGSCWEKDDENVYVLLTTLTLEEMKDKLSEYCWMQSFGWSGYSEFFSSVLEDALDEDDNTIYPCLLFEVAGTSWCPDINGHIETEYSAKTHLKLKDIYGIEDLEKRWDEIGRAHV